MTCLYFVVSGGVLSQGNPEACIPDTWQEQLIMDILLSLMISIVSFVPVAVLVKLSSRKLTVVDDEKEFKKQLRWWRIRDILVLFIGVLYWAVWVLYILGFLANVTEADTKKLIVTFITHLSVTWLLLPLLYTLVWAAVAVYVANQPDTVSDMLAVSRVRAFAQASEKVRETAAVAEAHNGPKLAWQEGPAMERRRNWASDWATSGPRVAPEHDPDDAPHVVSLSSRPSVCGKGKAESNVGDAPLGIILEDNTKHHQYEEAREEALVEWHPPNLGLQIARQPELPPLPPTQTGRYGAPGVPEEDIDIVVDVHPSFERWAQEWSHMQQIDYPSGLSWLSRSSQVFNSTQV